MLEAEKVAGESLAYSEFRFSRNPILIFRDLKFSTKEMGPIVFYSNSVFGVPAFFFFTKQLKLGNPSFSQRDVPSYFQRTDPQLTLSCIGSQENRRGNPRKRSSASGRTTKKEENNKSPVDKKLNSSNQEEIIALFRRIQSSLSKEESTNVEEIDSDASEDNPSAKSILNVLRRSRKGVKGKATNKEGSKVLTRRRAVPVKEQETQTNPLVTDFKLTRPSSKFVKTSPIPAPTAPRGKPFEPGSEATETDLFILEEMKLPELKKLAKSRGIRGYSKLKKSELVNLLRS